MDKHPGSLRLKNASDLRKFQRNTGDITDPPSVSELRKLELRVERLENESKVVAAQMRKVYGEKWMEDYISGKSTKK